MIRYALACDAGHAFESWFPSSSAYEDQSERALIACPVCQSKQVAKTIMAPAVLAGQNAGTSTDTADVVPEQAPRPNLGGRDARALLNKLRDKIITEAQDVGARFSDEARRMHDGDVAARPIYGQATVIEARELIEDGICVLPLPPAPDDLN